jgi:hypothetical protein
VRSVASDANDDQSITMDGRRQIFTHRPSGQSFQPHRPQMLDIVCLGGAGGNGSFFPPRLNGAIPAPPLELAIGNSGPPGR